MKLLIINAHPDDAEFTCASTCQQAVALGWDVHEILMTSDEYGTSRAEFKGKRIRRIRMQEMREAAKVYGTNPNGLAEINLIWLGEIDGYLPFHRNVFFKLRKKIVDLEPDIIIGPDSFYSMDLHPDHKHTGWLVYLAVKSLPPSKRPTLLLYHSFNPDFFVKVTDISIQMKAWSQHKSQTTPFLNKLLVPLRKIFYTFRRIKTGTHLAEGFRKATFHENENRLLSPWQRILYYLFASRMAGFPREYYRPTPQELGLL
ncbi:MAG: PIG-L deacetylase family protein [Promethearchaeia archaeon]